MFWPIPLSTQWTASSKHYGSYISSTLSYIWVTLLLSLTFMEDLNIYGLVVALTLLFAILLIWSCRPKFAPFVILSTLVYNFFVQLIGRCWSKIIYTYPSLVSLKIFSVLEEIDKSSNFFFLILVSLFIIMSDLRLKLSTQKNIYLKFK